MKSILQTELCGAQSPYQAAEELVRALAGAGEMQRIGRGERLFSSGEEARGVYLIVQGTARASLFGVPGRELMCRTAGAGLVLGLASALCANHYQFDAEAVEEVKAVFLPAGAVNDLLRQRPELCMQVVNMMCGELSALRQTTEHMRNCVQQSCLLHGRCTHALTSA